MIEKINYRKFFLANSKVTHSGFENPELFNLNDMEKGAVFCFPESLGVSYEYTVVENSVGVNIVNKENNNNLIKGEIIFKRKNNRETYDAYKKFLDYCNDELVFVQVLPSMNGGELQVDGVVYGSRVQLSKIEKTEIDYKTSSLRCSVEFVKLSGWGKNLFSPSASAVGQTFRENFSKIGDKLYRVRIYFNTKATKDCGIRIKGVLKNHFNDFIKFRWNVFDTKTNTSVGRGGIITNGALDNFELNTFDDKEILLVDGEMPGMSNSKRIDYSLRTKNVPFIFVKAPANKKLFLDVILEANKDFSDLTAFCDFYVEEVYDGV